MNKTINKDFYAITSYFNAAHTKERLSNYRIFKKNLALPLITVEWASDGIFELNQSDADLLIQIKEGDLMWQKERLLNIAIDNLPASSDYVAWLDCDIVFNDPSWHLKARDLLNRYDFIQLFDKVNYLPKMPASIFPIINYETIKYEHEVYSTTKIIEAGGNLFGGDINQWGKLKLNLNGNPGMAFASRVSTIKKHHFYDKNIVGAGDLILIACLFNRIDELFENRELSSAHKSDIKKWASKIWQENYKVSFLPGQLYHLWHGNLKNRNYATRWKILSSHKYDPLKSLTINSSHTWSWKKVSAIFIKDIQQYMKNKEI
jgi:hypothetical protein